MMSILCAIFQIYQLHLSVLLVILVIQNPIIVISANKSKNVLTVDESGRFVYSDVSFPRGWNPRLGGGVVPSTLINKNILLFA